MAGARQLAAPGRAVRQDDADRRPARGSEGRLTALVGVNVDDPAHEVRIPVDTLVLALGFTGPDATAVVEQRGVRLDAGGAIEVDATYVTSAPGVYCAGDVHRGASLIVWAIARGRELARHVDARLRAGPSVVPERGQDLPFR